LTASLTEQIKQAVALVGSARTGMRDRAQDHLRSFG
jgi:hypothetical protein